MQYRCDSGSPRRLQVRAWLLCSWLALCQPVLGSTTEAADSSAAVDRDEQVRRAALESAEVDTSVRADTGEDLASRFWIPRAELSSDEARSVPAFCSGRYVLPDFPYPLNSDPDDYPIRGDAENITYFLDGRVALNGAVTVFQGNRTLSAERGSLDRVAGHGLMTGRVQGLEPGLAFEGSAVRLDLDARSTEIDDVQFLLPYRQLRGDASSIAQDGQGNLVISDGRFTRCEPGNRNWHISASSLEVKHDEVFATARHAVVRVRDLPVLYVPYLRFPVRDDRQSGFLFPDLSFSERDGLDVRTPYYINLAPNYDATVSPRYISDRGPGLEGEFRHLESWGQTTFLGAYLYKDDIFDGTLSRDDFNSLKQQGLLEGDFKPAERWMYGIDHEAGFGKFFTLVDYRAVSDRDYFRDLGGDVGVASRIELERRGEIGYLDDGLQVRFWAQRFDRLDDGTVDPYERLPQLDVRYIGKSVGPFEWSVAGHLASFDRSIENLTGIDRAVGRRTHVEPRVNLPLYRPWGYLNFGAGLRYTAYDLRELDPGFERKPDRAISLGTVEGGLYLDRSMELFGRTLTHSLEPRAFYLYQTYENQDDLPRFDVTQLTFNFYQLFRDNRFSGSDRIGDANQLSLGLTTRFRDAANGREYFSANIGQILYFEDRRVTLTGAPNARNQESNSALLGQLSGTLTQYLRMNGTLNYDPNFNEVDEYTMGLQYRIDNRRILNLRYRNRLEDDISQADVSAYWPISDHFGVIARWNYDLEQGRVIETFGGLEYNDCCWQIRLVGRRFLNTATGPNLVTGQDDGIVRPEDGIFFQIVFKGMGGVGNSLESMLVRGIRGYTTEDYSEI